MANPAGTLDDGQLVQALELLLTKPQLLNDWEQDFAKGVTARFVRSGMTWSQRKYAKQIVGRVMERLAEKHGRQDLIERRPVPAPAPRIEAPRVVVFAPPTSLPPRTGFGLRTTAQVIKNLKPTHIAVLELLADGKQHPTGKGRIDGRTAKMLERDGLLWRDQGWLHGKTTNCQITTHGLAVLAHWKATHPATEVAKTSAARSGAPRGVWASNS